MKTVIKSEYIVFAGRLADARFTGQTQVEGASDYSVIEIANGNRLFVGRLDADFSRLISSVMKANDNLQQA